jgi:NAD(P)-dependent dehydrogenase (short-subunit alcohol dehydrogenase family)
MTAQYPEGYLDRMARDRTLMARLGEPEELAATLVWLVSPASGYVTGQTIVVDGGVSIT